MENKGMKDGEKIKYGVDDEIKKGKKMKMRKIKVGYNVNKVEMKKGKGGKMES